MKKRIVFGVFLFCLLAGAVFLYAQPRNSLSVDSAATKGWDAATLRKVREEERNTRAALEQMKSLARSLGNLPRLPHLDSVEGISLIDEPNNSPSRD